MVKGFLVSTLLFSLLGVALAKGERPVATVNGVVISTTAYQRALSASVRSHPEVPIRNARAATLEELINRELLAQEAARRKIEVTPKEVDAAVGEIRAHFRTDDSGMARNDDETEAAFQAELKTQRMTFEEFRKGLAPQILAHKLISAQTREAKAGAAQMEIAAFMNSLRERATIVRDAAAAAAVPVSTAEAAPAAAPTPSETPAKPWWDQ